MSGVDSITGRLRRWILTRVGEVVTTEEIMAVGVRPSTMRRFRELREIHGFPILSHHDRDDLKPDEYVLVSAPVERSSPETRIPSRVRAQVLENDGYTCQQCGAGPGDPDPCNPGRRVRLHVDHIDPAVQGGNITPANLRTLCSTCNQVRSNIRSPSETALNLLARIRRQPRSIQREVYERLRSSFEDGSAQ